ncbi:hypothetical protein AU210_015892 [Fusarium oxysporum f. sp. radicis-cucumerinum]|uniref:Bifunctional cytokinin biosynthesis protein n=1 Tax=Fusarium oxysporum f. sp. radicis-cucumerinum TaxID=327505 RepID=A0A2H3GCY4_FUSOX|nr:hypothetical protein AU210_015892 [Fusarium oxysporum f. sp. radicis-cucumerinum]
MHIDRKLCIAIFGPTASGKTKLGVTIAKALHGEVISVDSLQCYRPGSILTAKPDGEEIQDVPHHLIDYLEADDEPDDFVAMAAERMEEIASRKKLPMLVGGSTSLTLPILHEAFKRQYQMIAITLVPHQATYQALIQARGDEMLDRGLMDELTELRALEQTFHGSDTGLGRGIWKAIGYPEFRPYLEADAKAVDREQLFQNALGSMHANTFQYGLHQLRWIREILTPFLQQARVACISLPVTDKASWTSDVEGPAMSMASEFCHGSRIVRFRSNADSKSRVVCLFGGSAPGNDPAHIAAAKSLAVVLHRHDIKLVYGGGTTGIMGAIASTLVHLSGPSAVHGIIPAALVKYEEGASPRRADPLEFGTRTVVRDMHTRKRLMVKAVLDGAPGSGFVALSGGYGTMEELLEMTTWYQLGIHKCGICVFNVGEFYKGFLDWIDQVVQDGFVGQKDATILRMATSADEVVSCLSDKHHHSRCGELEWI